MPPVGRWWSTNRQRNLEFPDGPVCVWGDKGGNGHWVTIEQPWELRDSGYQIFCGDNDVIVHDNPKVSVRDYGMDGTLDRYHRARYLPAAALAARSPVQPTETAVVDANPAGSAWILIWFVVRVLLVIFVVWFVIAIISTFGGKRRWARWFRRCIVALVASVFLAGIGGFLYVALRNGHWLHAVVAVGTFVLLIPMFAIPLWLGIWRKPAWVRYLEKCGELSPTRIARVGLRPARGEVSSRLRNWLSRKQLTSSLPDAALAPPSRPGRPEVRIFVSSTFRDLQAEREQLVKKVFPRLRTLCNERGVEFTDVDLRWGITEEEAMRGGVIKTCLEEIERCRPYFIGILGERYGWIPPQTQLDHFPEIAESFSWLRQAMAEGLSVTEMEIFHGVLANPRMADHAFFYFRNPRSAASCEQADTGEAHERLQLLKQRIRSSGIPVREDFPDAETLGEWVFNDLSARIDGNYPARSTPGAFQIECEVQHAFSAALQAGYLPDPVLFDQLETHIEESGHPLVVLGDSGIGKSALLASWGAEYRRRHPDAFVIDHFIGVGNIAGDHVAMLRHIMEHIRRRYVVIEDIAAEPDRIVRDFPSWLARVSGEKLILVLDALDQLLPVGRNLHWLPENLPPQVRLIVSTLPGPSLDALQRRRWNTVAVRPLDETKREVIAVGVLKSYRKTLTASQLHKITANEKCSNPLFLRTLLEELRIFGSYEQLDSRIDHYLRAADLGDLFRLVLDRFSADFGENVCERLMLSLGAARRGLTEAELLEMIQCNRLRLSQALSAMGPHLLRRQGRLAFSHDYLKRAVMERYRNVGPAEAHRRLAEHFAALPALPRKAEELPWQLEQAEEWLALKDCLIDLHLFALLYTEGTKYEVLGYWVSLGSRFQLVEEYQTALSRFATESGPGEWPRAGLLVGQFVELAGFPDQSAALLRQALRKFEEEGETLSPELVACMNALGRTLRLNDPAGAATILRRGLSACETLYGRDHPRTAEVLTELGTTLVRLEKYDEGEKCLQRALKIRQQLFGPEHPLVAEILHELGRLYKARDKYGDVLPFLFSGKFLLPGRYLGQAFIMRHRTLGFGHPDVSKSLDELMKYEGAGFGAKVYESVRPFILKQTAASRRRVLGPGHPDTIKSICDLAEFHFQQGESNTAEQLLRRAMADCKAYLGGNHESYFTLLSYLESMLRAEGRNIDGWPGPAPTGAEERGWGPWLVRSLRRWQGGRNMLFGWYKLQSQMKHLLDPNLQTITHVDASRPGAPAAGENSGAKASLPVSVEGVVDPDSAGNTAARTPKKRKRPI